MKRYAKFKKEDQQQGDTTQHAAAPPPPTEGAPTPSHHDNHRSVGDAPSSGNRGRHVKHNGAIRRQDLRMKPEHEGEITRDKDVDRGNRPSSSRNYNNTSNQNNRNESTDALAPSTCSQMGNTQHNDYDSTKYSGRARRGEVGGRGRGNSNSTNQRARSRDSYPRSHRGTNSSTGHENTGINDNNNSNRGGRGGFKVRGHRGNYRESRGNRGGIRGGAISEEWGVGGAGSREGGAGVRDGGAGSRDGGAGSREGGRGNNRGHGFRGDWRGGDRFRGGFAAGRRGDYTRGRGSRLQLGDESRRVEGEYGDERDGAKQYGVMRQDDRLDFIEGLRDGEFSQSLAETRGHVIPEGLDLGTQRGLTNL